MNSFDFDLEDGEVVLVEYEPVDYDDYGEIEFECHVFNEAGKDIWDELSAKEQTEIEAQAGRDWNAYVRDQNAEAEISRWESKRDFP